MPQLRRSEPREPDALRSVPEAPVSNRSIKGGHDEHAGKIVHVVVNGKSYAARVDSKGRRSWVGEEPPKPKPGRPKLEENW